MKYTIIPKTKFAIYSRTLDKYNELMPVELKDGRFFIDADYLRPKEMVNPKSKVIFGTGIFEEIEGEQVEITITKTITTVLAEIQDSIKTYSVVQLTEDDFKVEIISK